MPQQIARQLQLVGLLPVPPLELGDPLLSSLALSRPALPARATRPPLEELVAPLVEERVGDLVGPAHLCDVAGLDPGEHDLELLLGCELTLLASVA